jgi:lipid-A-disaccharide synthase
VTTILLSAGDASGEAHAAALARSLRRDHPTWRFVGLGGPEMEAAGVELIADQRALAVGGFFELGRSARGILRAWRAMTRGLRAVEPDLVVLVDSGGFNLPFARHVRARSRARILYYVAPQVWAWRPHRWRKLARRSDRIAVLLPFERDFYRQHGVSVDYVGHPILDRELARPVPIDARSRARDALGLDPGVPLLGLFPGSRRNELEKHLPLQLAAFEALRASTPALTRLEAVLGLAPSLDPEWVQSLLEEAGAGRSLRCLPGDARLMDAVDVALAKPGTVTVELMLRERPMVVMGRVHPLTAMLAKRSLEVPWLSMPNLIAERAVVPELLQSEATPDRIAAALAPLFPEQAASSGPEAAEPSRAASTQIEALRRARGALGEPGATERVKRLVEEMLGTDPS